MQYVCMFRVFNWFRVHVPIDNHNILYHCDPARKINLRSWYFLVYRVKKIVVRSYTNAYGYIHWISSKSQQYKIQYPYIIKYIFLGWHRVHVTRNINYIHATRKKSYARSCTHIGTATQTKYFYSKHKCAAWRVKK